MNEIGTTPSVAVARGPEKAQTPALSVILPIHNEEGILMSAAEGFADHFDRIVGGLGWQFILVENGSTDRSPEIVDEISARWPASVTLKLPSGNYGNALLEGILASQGEWALIMNVDHLWDGPYFEWAWDHRAEFDLIMGSKRADPTINRQDQYRRVLTAGLNSLLQYLFDFVGADSHGMKLIRIPAIRPVAESCIMRRGQFDTEMTLRALRGGLWVAEIPIPYEEMRAARNFMLRKVFWNVRDLFRLYRVMKGVPYHGRLHYRRYCRDDLTGQGVSGKRPS